MAVDALAQVYAQALFNAASGAQRVPAVASALTTLGEVLRREPRLAECLDHPSLDRAAKQALADKAVAPLGEPLLAALMGVMVRKGRIRNLPSVIEGFFALADAKAGIKRGEVSAASALTPAQVEALGAALSKKLGGVFQLTSSHEPALLGGVRIRIDDKVYDGTLKRRLRDLEEQLLRDPALAGPNIWDN